MPRTPLIIRPRKLTIALPEDVAGRLELYLTSAFSGQVPKGAYQNFFVARINEFFERMTENDSRPADQSQSVEG